MLARFDRISELLDSRYRIPLTNVRLGWDPILGLVPVAGDVATLALSLMLVGYAHRLDAPRGLIARMLGNVAIDSAIGAIPFVGALFDLVFRANDRNLRLMLRHLEEEMARERGPGPKPPR